MLHFASKGSFLLLLAIPALVYLRARLGRRGSLRFSTTQHARQAGRSLRQRLLLLPMALRLLALALLVVALARPQLGKERIRDVSRGVAIEMVVDRSGSMGAEMDFGGERLNRLGVVKEVFKEFLFGNKKSLSGRPNDLVGMVAFARYADTVCPLTLGHGALGRFLESVKLVRLRSEDGTAIGDAVALAAARLNKADETLKRQIRDGSKDYTIKSKIIIVLTDGRNNAGKRSVEYGAELAKKWGIKIYSIGVGGEGLQRVRDPFGGFFLRAGFGGVDESSLKRLAETTGGMYRLAQDADALRAIYKEIDKLERSEIESVRFLDYKELFAPFAMGALALLFLQVALSCTLFRKIP